jgi:hypothetical protein
MHPSEGEIQEYLDGELDQSAMAQIEKHLQRCSSCAATWRALCAVVDSIEALPNKPLQRDLTPMVLTAIRPRSRSSFGLMVWATVQTVAVVALLVFTWSQVRMFLDPLLRNLLPLTASVTNKALFAGLLDAWDEMILIFEGLLLKSLTATQMWGFIGPHLAKYGWGFALALVLWFVGNGLLVKPIRLQREQKE